MRLPYFKIEKPKSILRSANFQIKKLKKHLNVASHSNENPGKHFKDGAH